MADWIAGDLSRQLVVASAAGALLLLLLASWLWRRRARATAEVSGKGVAPGPGAGGEGSRERFRRGLAKSRGALVGRLARAFGEARGESEELASEIERALLESDVGVHSTERILASLRTLPAAERTLDGMRAALHRKLTEMLRDGTPPEAPTSRPHVILVVGVNGVGKTTTIGKLAARHCAAGRSVLLIAADTFRAAAANQLSVWAERSGAQIVKQAQGADPSSVVFDGMSAAVARSVDVVLIDTAGRLHTKVNLMEELRKVRRVIERVVPGAPHEVLLVVDATTGQNAVSQARTFAAAVAVTGVVLTKLDGSARGGVVVAIRDELGLPVRFVGLGEAIEDLEPFDAEEFATALVAGGAPV